MCSVNMQTFYVIDISTEMQLPEGLEILHQQGGLLPTKLTPIRKDSVLFLQ